MPDLKERILYKDENLLVFNKAAGEAAQGAKGNIADLPSVLKKTLNISFCEAVHRLDVPATGCALFALKRRTFAFLSRAFSKNNDAGRPPVRKIYWAIAEKPVASFFESSFLESAKLVHYIETNPKTNKSFAYNENSPGRKKASLYYKITGEGQNYLFLEIDLLSGRHHQIRAQLAAAGLHIKGDLKYGAKRSEKSGGIRLHARSLSFPNPSDEKGFIQVTANPPQIDALWETFIIHTMKKR